MSTSGLDRASQPDNDHECALFASVRSGDSAAFKTLFHAYWRPLCVYADRVLGARDVAEDIVQAVFARMWERRETLAITGSVRGYLFTAVRNGVINHLKRDAFERKLSMTITQDPHALRASPIDAQAHLEHAEMVAALRDALHALPPRMRLVATMRWYERLSHAEIARALGVSPATVNNHLTAALKGMRKHLAGPTS